VRISKTGFALYFVLVSWLYALYSFDYRWALARQRLPERIALFQTHSAFFLGDKTLPQ
jgi:etoposide-induced 2.4 mRNA